MKRRVKIFIGCFSLAVVLFALFAACLIWTVRNRVDWKNKSPHQNQAILVGQLRQVAPEAQFGSDTCGLHTLRTIYRAYGIDPDKENLRARLGLDVPSNPVDPESTGTLQFDLLRVLVQDGFAFGIMDFSKDGIERRLSDHLLSNNMAAALIRRRQNGNLHWVALRGEPDGTLTVIDSLYEKPYTELLKDFVENCMLSGILVSPAGDDEVDRLSIRHAHYNGARDMAQTVERYRELNDRFSER